MTANKAMSNAHMVDSPRVMKLTNQQSRKAIADSGGRTRPARLRLKPSNTPTAIVETEASSAATEHRATSEAFTPCIRAS